MRLWFCWNTIEILVPTNSLWPLPAVNIDLIWRTRMLSAGKYIEFSDAADMSPIIIDAAHKGSCMTSVPNWWLIFISMNYLRNSSSAIAGIVPPITTLPDTSPWVSLSKGANPYKLNKSGAGCFKLACLLDLAKKQCLKCASHSGKDCDAEDQLPSDPSDQRVIHRRDSILSNTVAWFQQPTSFAI